MTRRLVSGVAAGLLAMAFAGSGQAQIGPGFMKADPRGYVPGPAFCDRNNCPGYVVMGFDAPGNNVVRSGTYNGAMGIAGNLCWRQGYWTPAMAIPQCEPDLVPKPAPPAAASPADHARVEGAVRLRQGGPQARRQGGDRQRDHFEARQRAAARAGAG